MCSLSRPAPKVEKKYIPLQKNYAFQWLCEKILFGRVFVMQESTSQCSTLVAWPQNVGGTEGAARHSIALLAFLLRMPFFFHSRCGLAETRTRAQHTTTFFFFVVVVVVVLSVRSPKQAYDDAAAPAAVAAAAAMYIVCSLRARARALSASACLCMRKELCGCTLCNIGPQTF